MNSSTVGDKYARGELRKMAREVLADRTVRKPMLVAAMCARTGRQPDEVMSIIEALASEEVDVYA